MELNRQLEETTENIVLTQTLLINRLQQLKALNNDFRDDAEYQRLNDELSLLTRKRVNIRTQLGQDLEQYRIELNIFETIENIDGSPLTEERRIELRQLL